MRPVGANAFYRKLEACQINQIMVKVLTWNFSVHMAVIYAVLLAF
jgi:hypothetical protein